MLGFKSTGGVDENMDNFSMTNLFAPCGPYSMYSSRSGKNINVTGIFIKEDLQSIFQEGKHIKKLFWP
jgi:hypothetical protein